MKRLQHSTAKVRRVRWINAESEPKDMLIPIEFSGQGGRTQAPMPSNEGFLRQIGRVWIRRAMLLCAVGAVGCALAVPLLSLLRVNQVSVAGVSHYDEQELIQISAVSVGDELLLHSPEQVEDKLLKQCPYLASVEFKRTLTGKVSITVTERTPRWALLLSDGKVALLDEDMYVLEIGAKDAFDASLCQVSFELFPTPEQPSEAQEQPPMTLTPGQMYQGNPSAIAKLSEIAAAMQSVLSTDAPLLLDMTDPYAIRLTLSDGTLLLLHECRDPQRQLRMAMDALDSYWALHGQSGGAMQVDVDDFYHVTLRPIAQKPQ